MQVITVKLPIWKWNITFMVNSQYETFVAYCKKKGVDKDEDWGDADDAAGQYVPDVPAIWISKFDKSPQAFESLSHEILHAVMHIMHNRGADRTIRENWIQEQYTYTMGYIMKDFLTQYNAYTKNKKRREGDEVPQKGQADNAKKAETSNSTKPNRKK